MYSILLPQSEAGLFFNAPKRAYWYVSLRIRHSNAAFFSGVLELLVTSFVINLIPAVVG